MRLAALFLLAPAAGSEPAERRAAYEKLFPPYAPIPAEAEAWIAKLETGKTDASDRETFFTGMPRGRAGSPGAAREKSGRRFRQGAPEKSIARAGG